MEDAKRLIRQAFEQARASGKPDWYRMTTAVLKNRLLDLTDRTFDESDYGAETFTAFLHQVVDLVTVDGSRVPPIVELKEPETHALERGDEGPSASRRRIRSDLWRAALDYSSGTEYVWDTADGRARPRQIGDECPLISTVMPTTHQRWRREFAETVRTSATTVLEHQEQVEIWVTDQLPISKLPQPLIPRWNVFLVDKVHRHLLGWFGKSELDPPGDLISEVADPTARRTSENEALRRLVMRVVGEMTDRELEQLDLPARAVLRATGRARS